jgi:hypothetical protein
VTAADADAAAAAAKRVRVDKLLASLVREAMGAFDADMGEPCAVSVSILWLSGAEDTMAIGAASQVALTTAYTAIHKTCALDPEYVIDVLSQALDDSEYAGELSTATSSEKPS